MADMLADLIEAFKQQERRQEAKVKVTGKLESGIHCVCDNCGGYFTLVMKDYDVAPGTTYIHMNGGGDSCGVYACQVCCPYCDHEHEL